MENLIKIGKNENGDAVVSARELHAFLEVRNHFTQWFDDNKNQFDKDVDYQPIKVYLKHENGTGGTNRTDYALTLDCAKEMAMMSKVAKGKTARRYFIACERKLRDALPQVRDPKAAALIHAIAKLDAMEQEQERIGLEQQEQSRKVAALREEVAVIEARTQPECRHFTVMGWARLQGQSLPLNGASALGRKCAVLSRQRGLPIGDVSDPRFGRVHSYHDSVLESVFGKQQKKKWRPARTY